MRKSWALLQLNLILPTCSLTLRWVMQRRKAPTLRTPAAPQKRPPGRGARFSLTTMLSPGKGTKSSTLVKGDTWHK